MAKPKELTGALFSHILVLGPAGTNRYGNRLWRCRCTLCGREDVVRTTGNVQRSYSCGCRTARFRSVPGSDRSTTPGIG